MFSQVLDRLVLLTPRQVFIALALLAGASLLVAKVFMQEVLGLAPCPLCMTQRVFVGATGLSALVAAVHNCDGLGRRIYAGFCILFSVTGGFFAGRHVWLQYLPPEEVPACGPSLEYMLETLPFSETLSILMMGDGNCAERMWTFLGLSIPEQTLALFVLMTLLGLWQMIRPNPGTAGD